jgi:hypothetical protein
MTLEQILQMMRPSQTQGMMTEGDMLRAARQGAEMAKMQRDQQAGMATDADMARMLSLPAAENMPNYANNEMPLYTGGLLENMQGQAVDPQQLLNTAYDMSAPREMRINAIERLRALGVI